jgi:hypothetical protein
MIAALRLLPDFSPIKIIGLNNSMCYENFSTLFKVPVCGRQ